MTFLLNASACPPVAPWDAFTGNAISIASAFTASPTAPVSRSFSMGDTLSVPGALSGNAAITDSNARYGGGMYGVAHGLALSAGTGLLVSVATGLALMDGSVEVAAPLTHAVPASSLSFVWLQRPAPGGTPTLYVSTSTTPPASPAVLLGNVTTSGTAVTAVDYSGVMTVRGGRGFRQTADAGAPTDTPPATTSFTAITAGGVYDWTGAAYVQKPAPKTVVTLPAHSVTVTATDVNDRIGVDFSGVGSFANANYRVLSCLCSDPLVIVTENLGPKTPTKAFFTVYQPSSDAGGAFTLTVTLEGAGWTPNPSPAAPAWDSPAAIG